MSRLSLGNIWLNTGLSLGYPNSCLGFERELSSHCCGLRRNWKVGEPGSGIFFAYVLRA
jgi:hypothetical protein